VLSESQVKLLGLPWDKESTKEPITAQQAAEDTLQSVLSQTKPTV
jgi:hypothetical protein